MKKKIIVISHGLEIGGAERALLGLLYSFDYMRYDVDLFLMHHQGELMEYIPQQVNLLPEKIEYTCLAVPISEVIKKKKVRMLFGRIYGKFKAKKFIKENALPADNGVELEYSHKYTCKYVPEISDKKYDLVISFLTPHYFAANKVNAKKKIAWIHTDYSYVELDQKSELRMWEVYDYIASISDACTKGFCKKFPTLKNKIIRVDNIISTDFIKSQAMAFDVSEEMKKDGSINILSVGRFCNQKNFDNVPDVCKKICESGLKIKWYLIGFGRDEELIKRKIAEANMQEYVKILGKKENPYPYIQACDVYIQPSRYEGKCVTVREAQMLGKPVIITNYETAKEQLESGVEGIIVPMQNQECADQIFDLLNNNCLLEQLSFNCQMRKYSNKEEVKKIYRILEKSNCVGKR